MTIKNTDVQTKNMDVIPHFLPLLDYINDVCSLEKNRPFLGYKVLAVQHLLGASIPFFSMLEKGGIKAEDIHIIGKAYSSSPTVVEYLLQKGYNLKFDAVFDYRQDEPYDSILKKHILSDTVDILEKINTHQRCLVIDDGAKAIELLHLKYPKLAPCFACVEQTSRGARAVNKLSLLCPVINVARSEAKTVYEAPMIAQAMVEEFISSLRLWESSDVFQLSNKKILLLGYGFIGENVAEKLINYGFEVIVHDSDSDRAKKAQKDGLILVKDLKQVSRKVAVVIGCSGTQVMQHNDLEMFQSGTLLVNMASTDLEFSAWQLRPRGEIVYQHVLPVDLEYLEKYIPLPWRSLYKVKLTKTNLYLANGGFPIDFCGKINPVPSDDIQFTSALLLAGAIQAVSEKEAKLVDLDSRLQDKIVVEYLKLKQPEY